MDITRVLSTVLDRATDGNIGVRFETPDGAWVGDEAASTTIRVRGTDAVAHLARAPGELGFGRAYVSGALDIDGSIWDVVAMKDHLLPLNRQPIAVAEIAASLARELPRSIDPPPEEAPSRRWLTHTVAGDAEDIRHHYDVGNDFYAIVLGPAMTYSCAVFEHEDSSLEQAQWTKHELICRKLGIDQTTRMLDIGCGWGSLAIHAAREHGAEVVGVTISQEQAKLARERVNAAGLTDAVDIQLTDYRDLEGGPFDAISSVGMLEHVGRANLGRYFATVHSLLSPGGRLLNHQIGRTADPRGLGLPGRTRVHRRGFVHRYIFPERGAPRDRSAHHCRPTSRARGPPHGIVARALRPDPPTLGREPGSRLGRRSGIGRRGADPRLASLHGGVLTPVHHG
jgi:cyclopropane-fatty-acyl-phospholipid synthase